MKLEITSTPKGKKTQFICTADGVEIGKRCSAREYVKCVVVKESKSFELKKALSSKAYNLKESAKYERGADCKTLEEFVNTNAGNGSSFPYVLDGSYSEWSEQHATRAAQLQNRIEEIESGAADDEFERLFVLSWHMSCTAEFDAKGLVLVSEVYA
tara:strand:- start:57 stop:524 length:468 start_codon:yes stop_codon:yes gene_type:complete